jgi:hypothetical protein
MGYEGKAYQAPSGQWSWVVQEDGEDVARGAGYESEDEALEAMYEHFHDFVRRE